MAVRENPPLWLQNFRQASFKGKPFYVDSVDSGFGRRTVTHEYPQRDQPYTEDLGRKAREFTITGYLVGGNYQLARDNLIKECEKPGAGELIHPYMGPLQVVCRGFTVRERRQDGGYCELSISFVEDGDNVFPAAIINTGTAVDLAANAVQSSTGDWFELAYDIARLPEFVREEMNDAANFLLGPVDRLLTASVEFADEVAALKRDMGSIIYRPRALYAGFLNVINKITSLTGKNKQSSATLHEMALSALKLVPETTGTRTRQSRAQNNMQAMVQQLAVAEHSRVVAGQPYESYTDALNARAEMIDEIDTVSETAPDEVFIAMQDMRAKLSQALPNPRLPEIQTIDLRAPLPALVLAYRIYADPLRDADIVGRNKIVNPGFLPARSIEVVVNA
jgi:prophage DNA circulation protein